MTDERLREALERLVDEYEEDRTRPPSFVTMDLARASLAATPGLPARGKSPFIETLRHYADRAHANERYRAMVPEVVLRDAIALLDEYRAATPESTRKPEPIGSDPDNEVDAGDWFAATPEPTLDVERLAEAIEVQDPSIPDPRAFADGVADVYARPIVRDWPRVFVHPAANLDLATLEYVKESIEGIQHGGGTVEPFGLIESIIRVRAELRGDATP